MVAILHNIRSLHNVGSIFRTADAAGIEKLYLCGITPAPVNRFGKIEPKLAKVALGAEKTVSWERCVSTTRLIAKLKKDGYKIFAVEQTKNSISYYTLHPKRYTLNQVALLLGNEVKGLSPAILKKADKILEIPMRGAMIRQAHHPRRTSRGKESLNVAVAAGIVIFHFLYGR